MNDSADMQELTLLESKYDGLVRGVEDGHFSPEFTEFMRQSALQMKPRMQELQTRLLDPLHEKEEKEKQTQLTMGAVHHELEELSREEAKKQHSYWMDFEFQKQEEVDRYVAFVLENEDKLTDEEKHQAAEKMQEAEDKGFDLGNKGRDWKARNDEFKDKEEEQEQQMEGLAALSFGDEMDFDSAMSPTDLPINKAPGQGKSIPS